ncbi:hypothetical protein BJY52DRAFT_1229499 [Lactarius psammicola]|nr:hypothetical protein BJY52DRAFT_1229499 [Lactarius psammicola]
MISLCYHSPTLSPETEATSLPQFSSYRKAFVSTQLSAVLQCTSPLPVPTAALAQLTHKWLRHIIQDHGPGKHNPEEDASRIMRSCSHKNRLNGAPMRTAIVNDGNPGTRHGTSATALATTVACVNDAEVLDRLLKVLNSHECTFEQLMGVFVAFYYGNLTHPSQDRPHIGLLSIVPPDTVQHLQAAVQLANATLGGNFPSVILCGQITTKVTDIIVVTLEAVPSSVPSSSGTGVAGVPQAHSTPSSQISHSSGATSMLTSPIGVIRLLTAVSATLAL